LNSIGIFNPIKGALCKFEKGELNDRSKEKICTGNGGSETIAVLKSG